MKIKINKRTLIQYIMIYMILVFNGSRLLSIMLEENYNILYGIEIGFVLLGIFLAFVKKAYRNQYVYLYIVLSLCSIIVTRLLVGGVGLTIWLEWTLYILITYIAIQINVNTFLRNYISFVYVLAFISLIFYSIQLVNPDMLKVVFNEYNSGFTHTIWESGSVYTVIPYKSWGAILYNMREGEMNRNLGIFTEPGVYQIVLNSAMFILLFMKEKVEFCNKKYKRKIAVIILAIITCQSTTGYIGAIIIIMGFFCDQRRNYKQREMRRNISLFTILVVIILFINHLVMGEESLVSVSLLSKLFGVNGKFSLIESTGLYRISVIITSVNSMIKNPLGIGFDSANELIQETLAGSAGAVIFVTGAALGIFMFLGIFVWTLYPIIKSNEIKFVAKITFLFIYINTMLAQSEELYTSLIMFTIYFFIHKRKENATLDFNEKNQNIRIAVESS